MVQHADIDHTGIPGAGGTLPSGTAFPGSPATDDFFYRTNVRGGMLFTYDGTRWVSDQLFSWNVGAVDAVAADSTRTFFPVPPDLQIYVDSWQTAMFIAGTGVWIATLDLYDFEADIVNLATKSSTGQTASRFYHYHDAIGTVVDGTGGNAANAKSAIALWFDESSGTATCIAGATVFYRIIST